MNEEKLARNIRGDIEKETKESVTKSRGESYVLRVQIKAKR